MALHILSGLVIFARPWWRIVWIRCRKRLSLLLLLLLMLIARWIVCVVWLTIVREGRLWVS
jgi:hypothetical protein